MRVVVFGGGTGIGPAIEALKQISDHLTAVVSMFDTGGSAGIALNVFGAPLPQSDWWKAALAMAPSDIDDVLLKLATHRFHSSSYLSGMAMGTLMMLALSQIEGGEREAAVAASRLFRIQGDVLGVTEFRSDLVAMYENGMEIFQEHRIDAAEKDWQQTNKIVELRLVPPVDASVDVLKAITESDFIVFAPWDLITSIVPNLLQRGIVEAISGSRAPLVMVMNIMTKLGQTHRMTASGHIEVLESYLRMRKIRVAVLNNEPIPAKAREMYRLQKAEQVIDDLDRRPEVLTVRGNMLYDGLFSKVPGDIPRSLLRHNPDALEQAFREIFQR